MGTTYRLPDPLSQRPITVTRALVEQIEGEAAHLLLGDERAWVPLAILPDGVGIGSWVELRVTGLSAQGGGDREPGT